MAHTGLSRRARTFVLWTARLALVVYLVQLVAVDHWHGQVSDVVGIEGSAAHVQHCHGAGDCATGSGPAVALSAADLIRLPVPPAATLTGNIDDQPIPSSVFIQPPYEPPRAA